MDDNLSLPKDPFNMGLEFSADEYPRRLKLPSRVSALQTQLGMMKIRSDVQNKEDTHMKTSLGRPALFADEFSFARIGKSCSTSSAFEHGGNRPTHSWISTEILSMAKSLEGSAMLKEKLLEKDPQSTAAIVSAVEGHVYELIFDQFGSSFLQALFESMADENIEGMLQELLRGQEILKNACVHNFGNIAVRELMRRLKSKNQMCKFTNIMRKYVMALTKNTTGSLVILECFRILSQHYIQILMREVVENCFAVATDRTGCWIMQLYMSYCDEYTLSDLAFGVSENALLLSEHPCGNYAVQSVIELVKEGLVSADILSKFKGHYVDMSMSKYGSRVVEKCINYLPQMYVFRVVWEIIDSPRFWIVIQDSFGNHVLQCAVKKFRGMFIQELITIIDQYGTALSSQPHAGVVIEKESARMGHI